MLLKSLAALALAAQASALGVGVYTDAGCTTLEATSIVSVGTCSPNAQTTYVGVSACSSGTTATIAVLPPNGDCSGTALYTGDITTSCTMLTASGSNPRRYAKIETSIDSTCGDAAKSFVNMGYADATCTTPASGGIIIADDVCRGRSKVRLREAGCRIPLTPSLLHPSAQTEPTHTHTRALVPTHPTPRAVYHHRRPHHHHSLFRQRVHHLHVHPLWHPLHRHLQGLQPCRQHRERKHRQRQGPPPPRLPPGLRHPHLWRL
jgi:hypothetical protein